MTKLVFDLPRTGEGPTWKIRFFERPVAKKQARFGGRKMLVPDIDLKAYECRAVLDWIDILIDTNRPTQWKWIQHHLEREIGQKFYVADESGTGERMAFRVRFQEPDPLMLRTVFQTLNDRWGLAGVPLIANLELSIDFRPRHPSEGALAKLYAVLVRSHIPKRDVLTELLDRPRFAWGPGPENTRHLLPYDRKRPERNDELLRSIGNDEPPPLDATYYVGAQGSAAQWKTMIKLKDRQNRAAGTWLDLPDDERRVRIEVTLNQEELRIRGIETLEDLQTYRFQTFQGQYFTFRLPTFRDYSAEPPGSSRAVGERMEQERVRKFLDAGVVGLKAMEDAKGRMNKAGRKNLKRALGRPLVRAGRVGTGSSSTLVAYEDVQRKVYQALRHLGERVREAVS